MTKTASYWETQFAAINREIDRVEGVRKKEADRRAKLSAAMTRSPAFNKARVASKEERATVSRVFLGLGTNRTKFCRKAAVGYKTVLKILQGMPVGSHSIEKSVAFAKGRELHEQEERK